MGNGMKRKCRGCGDVWRESALLYGYCISCKSKGLDRHITNREIRDLFDRGSEQIRSEFNKIRPKF